jgi:hypothetical protein
MRKDRNTQHYVPIFQHREEKGKTGGVRFPRESVFSGCFTLSPFDPPLRRFEHNFVPFPGLTPSHPAREKTGWAHLQQGYSGRSMCQGHWSDFALPRILSRQPPPCHPKPETLQPAPIAPTEASLHVASQIDIELMIRWGRSRAASLQNKF